MAAGIISYPRKGIADFFLVTGATATQAGTWVEGQGILRFGVDITATAAIVQLHISSTATQPANSANGVILSTVSGTRKMIMVSGPIKYIKAKVTSRTAGTVVVRAQGALVAMI